MSLNFTTNTKRALDELSIEPNIAVKIEGFDVLFSANPLKEYITINCPGFFIGEEGFFVGGLKDISPDLNKTLIDSRSTTYTIRQQINHDEGKSSSISTMTVGLVDKDQFVTNLISPGQVLDDILGRRVQIFVTFGSVSFFDDAIEIFKGTVAGVESGPGLIRLKINHPDAKKNVEIFQKIETTLSSAISSTQTSIPVEDSSAYITPSGPLRTYARIESGEIIEYTSV